MCTVLFFGNYYTLQSILRLSPPRQWLHSVSPEHIVVRISVLSCANHLVGKTHYSSSLHHRSDINRKSTTSENPDHVICSLYTDSLNIPIVCTAGMFGMLRRVYW